MSILSGKEEDVLAKARAVAREFAYEPEDVARGVAEYLRLMGEGLDKPNEAMAMTPTYVTAVPNGTEMGIYFAVELDSTNIRVCSIDLHGDGKYTLEQSKTPLPRRLRAGTSKDLFSFVAKQIASFLQRHHGDNYQAQAPDGRLRLGFAFSFPFEQVALDKGFLSRWTEGFDIPDAIGKDVCGLLQAEIDVLSVPLQVVALVSGTVGTLMARAYTSPEKAGPLIGATFAADTNGAYVEKVSRIGKLHSSSKGGGVGDGSSGVMLIKTEWGAFDNAMRSLPDTPYDRALDKSSVNPGVQMFEKRVSGKFLGEILRLAIVELISQGLFQATRDIKVDDNGPLFTPWSIDTEALGDIQADYTPGYVLTKQRLEAEMGVSSASTGDAMAVKALVYGILKRSARLAAVPIAATAIATGAYEAYRQAMDEATNPATVDKIDVGVDASVFEYCPEFERYLRGALRDVQPLVAGAAGLEDAIRIGIVRQGDVVGAALAAATAP